MRDRRHQRQDVAPDVRRGRIAVEKQRDGRAFRAGLAIGHAASEDGRFANLDVDRLGHVGSLNTVWNAMALKRSSAFGLRSTFMRRIAPCQDASRKSASSSGSKSDAISPLACASL